MLNTEFSIRKDIRLKDYDYSKEGYYFVTICTNNRVNLLCSIEAENNSKGFKINPTDIGIKIENSVLGIPLRFHGFFVDQYVIMPNHLHIIIVIDSIDEQKNVTLQDVVGRLKSFTTHEYNRLKGTKNLTLWQRTFYEHIIRNVQELDEIRKYIENNPLKWKEDKYYIELI